MRIAVIGAGLMGHGIAQVFASAGHEVWLMDLQPARLWEALEGIRRNLEVMAEEGKAVPGGAEPVLERIRTTPDMEEAAKGAEFVVEAVPERLDLKQDLFRHLDAACGPEVVLATNTSVMRITEIASRSKGRYRIVGTHFWNPPYLVPLVEVVPGEETAESTVERACRLLESAGMRPVRLKRDVPGFVGNRLQHALWREAISIVEKGIADAETVDEVVKSGFGRRLAVLGPLENADLVGLDLTLRIHEYLFPHLEDSHRPSPLLRKKVESGELGFRSGKGFREWTQREMEECRRKLQRHLLRGASM